MTKREKWMELRERYFNKEISEMEYYNLCEEAGLEVTGWIDEELARKNGFTGDSIDLVSFATEDE